MNRDLPNDDIRFGSIWFGNQTHKKVSILFDDRKKVEFNLPLFRLIFRSISFDLLRRVYALNTQRCICCIVREFLVIYRAKLPKLQ